VKIKEIGLRNEKERGRRKWEGKIAERIYIYIFFNISGKGGSHLHAGNISTMTYMHDNE